MRKFNSVKIIDSCLIRVINPSERFISVCVALGVEIFEFSLNSQEENEQLLFLIRTNDIKKIKEASVKTGVKFIVEKTYGVVPFLRKIFSRRTFFAAIALGVLFLCFLTLFIWQIQIIGCVNQDKDEILRVINDSGISYGMLKSNCDCEKLEEAIRNEFQDILWVSVSIDGTGLFVRIKENTYLNDKLAISEEKADLISDSNGVVISIITRNGVPKVKEGDEIKEGDLLISGVKEYYNDAGEIYKTEHVCADGDIIIESIDSQTWVYNKTFTVKACKDVKRGIKLRFFDKTVFDYSPKLKGVYDTLKNDKVLVIGNDLYLPINLTITKNKIYSLEERQLSDDEIRLYAGIMYKLFCIQEMAKGVDIIEKNATISFSDSSGQVNASMVVHKKCGVKTGITIEEIQEIDEEIGEEIGN